MSELKKFIKVSMCRDMTVEQFVDAMDKMEAQLNAKDAEIERLKVLEEVLSGVLAIVNDSQGVAGYHNNGDIADWDEFEEITEVERALRGEDGET